MDTVEPYEGASELRSDLQISSSERLCGEEIEMQSSSQKHPNTVGEESDDRLKRSIGLFGSIMLLTGSIIGSGIFVTPTAVMATVGSPGWCLIIWGVSGAVSFMAALVYVELASVVPQSGGDYVYLAAAFSPLHRFWGPLLPFMYSWISTTLMRPCSLVVIAMTCARYTVLLLAVNLELGMDDNTEYYLVRTITFLGLCIITLLNWINVNCTTVVQTLLTTCKVAVLVLIAGVGIKVMVHDWALKQFGWSNQLIKDTVEPERYLGVTPSFGKIATAGLYAMWSYGGWNSLNFVTEELQNPKRNLILAVCISIPLTILCYILVNVGLFGVLTKQQVIDSSAVAVQWADKMQSPYTILIPIGVVLSTLGAAHSYMFTASRISFAAARGGHILEAFSYVHVRRNTPTPALIVTSALSMVMIPFDITVLFKIFLLTQWIFYGFTMVAFIILKLTQPDAPRPIKCPTALAIIVFVVSCFLVIATLISDHDIRYIYVGVYLLVGLIFYVPFIFYGVQVPGTPRLNHVIQVLFQVAPMKKATQ